MSRIESRLTDDERRVLGLYRDPNASDYRRNIRLSIQYAVGTGVFLAAALVTGNAWWSLVVYGTFVAFLFVRLVGMRRIIGVMPSIIEKYESRIEELETQVDAVEGR